MTISSPCTLSKDQGDFNFKTRPYNHQLAVWKRSRDDENFALFMDMGTGKTKVVADTLAWLWLADKIDRVVIQAPKGSYRVWEAEMAAHLGVPYYLATWASNPRKADREQLEALSEVTGKLRILVVNIEAWVTKKAVSFTEQFMQGGKVLIAVDESTCIKNPKAKRTKVAVELSRSKFVQYRRILSGDPAANSPLDLFAQCRFLDANLLGFRSFYAFRSQYADMMVMSAGQRSFRKVVGYRNLEELKGRVAKFAAIVKKQDCLDLPPKVYQVRHVDLSAEQRRLYKSLVDDSIAIIDAQHVVTAELVITRLLRLHQVSMGFTIDEDGKPHDVENVPRLTELVALMRENPVKTIVWVPFRPALKRVADLLRSEFGPESGVEYHGGINDADRAEAVTKFQQAGGKVRWFLSNQQTGSYGLTLTRAEMVVYFGNHNRPGYRNQSEDRAHRIGLEHSVTYVDLVSPGTVDEGLLKALRDKRNVAASITPSNWRQFIDPS